jgi:hypothetical protein
MLDMLISLSEGMCWLHYIKFDTGEQQMTQYKDHKTWTNVGTKFFAFKQNKSYLSANILHAQHSLMTLCFLALDCTRTRKQVD